MAEGKKRAYKRETCEQKICEFVERARQVNAGEADYQYYNRIRDIILFGSMVNTEKDTVHDVDLCVKWTDDRKLMRRFYEENAATVHAKFTDIVNALFAEWFLTKRYLKGRCGIFSVHCNAEEGAGIFDIATADKHLYLMKDGVVNEKALEVFRKK